MLERLGRRVDLQGKKNMARAYANAIQRACLALKDYSKGYAISERNTVSVKNAASKLTFQAIYDMWHLERSPRPKTAYEYRRALSDLEKHSGLDDINLLSSIHIFSWKKALLERRLKAKTINDTFLAAIKAMLSVAVSNKVIAENAASGFKIVRSEQANEKIRSYNEEEAKLILTAARNHKNVVMRWMPWLCAYTGARLGEVSQLRSTDIVKVGDIWVIKIDPSAGSLKTLRSERMIPVHPRLEAEGFISFTQTTTGVLFPTLVPDTFGSIGGTATKSVGRWIRSLGVVDTRISPSHSWRHRFRTLAREHDLSIDIADALIGHARKNVADRYGEFSVAALYREISKIP